MYGSRPEPAPVCLKPGPGRPIPTSVGVSELQASFAWLIACNRAMQGVIDACKYSGQQCAFAGMTVVAQGVVGLGVLAPQPPAKKIKAPCSPRLCLAILTLCC